MQGKICVVTGANSGIGLATAAGLAKMGAHVVMVARSREKGEAALAEVKAKSRSSEVTLLLADLASQGQIHALADQIIARYRHLDVLINNAAIIPAKREVSPDGYEMQFAVNHLAYFLLTHRLLDLLKSSAPSRIVNLSSSLHASGKVDFTDLQSERSYTMMGWATYGNTKLYNLLFTYELARRLEGTGVTVNAVHPGVIGTNLTRTMPGFLQPLYRAFVGSPEKGAQTSLFVATSPTLANVTGKYFVNSKITESSAASHDREAARRLWELSEEYTGIAVR